MGKEKCRKYFGERVQVENKVFYEVDVESIEGSSSFCDTGYYLVCYLNYCRRIRRNTLQ